MTTAFYGRYSTDLQNTNSVNDQLAECRRHFESDTRVGAIGLVFKDHAISGTTTARPGYQALLGAIQDGTVKVVVAESLDRLTRSFQDAAALSEVLKDANAKCFTKSEGELTIWHFAMMGVMNQWTVEEIARKVKRGIIAQVLAGKHVGPVPFGYDAGEAIGSRVINATEAAIVERVFDMTISGSSGVQIAKIFNQERLPAPRGTRWRSSTIVGDRRSGDGILNNQMYRGRLVYNRHEFKRDRASGTRRGTRRPESEWLIVEASHLRIIDEDRWRKVQEVLSARAQSERLHSRRRPKRLLSGLIKCSTCGALFTVVNRDRLACSNAKDGLCSERGRLPWSVVERRVLSGVKQNLLAPDIVAGAVKQCRQHIRAQTSEQDRRRREAERDLQNARRTANEIVDMMLKTKSTTMASRLEDTEREIGRLEQTLKEAGDAVVVTIHPGAPEAYRRRIMNLEEALDDEGRSIELAKVIRPLIAGVSVRSCTDAPDGWEAVLQGQLAAIMALTSKNPGVSAGASVQRTAMVGAGVGFEPTTFRL